MNFGVDIVDLDKKPHNACFIEVARGLSEALGRLGYCPQSLRATDHRIVFGANAKDAIVSPSDILFNAEILGPSVDPSTLLALGSPERLIWDYAATNADRLRPLGLGRPVHCPIGYTENMTCIEPAADEDVDVLFYGWVSDGRRSLINDLKKAGLNVKWLVGKYGRERDGWIARSKIVLNLHYYEHSVFEIFRCSHLLANRKCVVTEAGGKDPGLEQLAQDSCFYAPRDQLVEVCRSLRDAPGLRRIYAERGFEEFRKIRFDDSVSRSLAMSGLC